MTSDQRPATSDYHYENFERERLDPIYETVKPYSWMAKNERYFLNGMIRALNPRKILEAGVSDGGGSAIILNAIQDIEGTKLYSVDYSEKAYKHPDKLSGWFVDEKFPHLKNKWQIYRGGDLSCFLEDIGDNIDMLVLDTVHRHPWETLNFLCVLPFMNQNGSWVILHDITDFVRPVARNALACRYLFGHVVSYEKFSPVSDHDKQPANIGAFKVSEITAKYIDNLFISLFLPWASVVSEKDFDSMKQIIRKYYTSEQYKTFCDAFDFQNYLLEQEQNEPEKKVSLSLLAKVFVKQTTPGLYSLLRRIKHSLK